MLFCQCRLPKQVRRRGRQISIDRQSAHLDYMYSWFSTSDGVQLLLDDGDCCTRFTFLKSLAEASDHWHTMVNGKANLLTDNLVVLAIVLSAFWMSQDHPRDAHILKMFNTHFTSVSSELGEGGVLGSDLDVLLKVLLHPWQVHCDWRDSHLYW